MAVGGIGSLVRDLRSELRESVITPDHSGYDDARSVFFGGTDRRPAVVVHVANAADVSPIIKFAREA
ncbi:MAG: hypothetical protein ACT4OI_06435 [Methanobacteriota archaeon]